jgi:hypothetical protein
VAKTPEGKVKDLVKKMLKDFGPEVYSHWPVQNGMGSPTLDCIICAWGSYVAIETKVEGKDLTPRQNTTMSTMVAAGAVVYIVRNAHDVEFVRCGLEMLKYANHRQQ